MINRPRQHSPNAETLPPPAQPLVNTQGPHTISQKPDQDRVTEERKQTRSPVAAILGSFVVGAAIAGGTGYAVMTGYKPFEKKSAPNSIPSASASASENPTPLKPKPPTEIQKPEDLKATLDYFDIVVKPEDFEKSAKENLHLKALQLVIDKEPADEYEQVKYHWAAMENRRFNSFSKNDIVIATYVKNPGHTRLLGHMGIQPKTFYVDAANPQITIHYYVRVSGKTAGIASIKIGDPKRPSRNLTIIPLDLRGYADEAGPSADGGGAQQ